MSASLRLLGSTIAAAVMACSLASDDDGTQSPLEQGIPALPGIPICEAFDAWDPELEREELELLAHINALRERGADCGERGWFAPAPPLEAHGALWCAARGHAADMLEREFFDHEDPDGALPWDRLREVEYAFYDANETIAIGALSPSEVMDEIWMPRDGSCAALMAAEFEEVGVGAGGSVGPDLAFTRAWTVLVALPR